MSCWYLVSSKRVRLNPKMTYHSDAMPGVVAAVAPRLSQYHIRIRSILITSITSIISITIMRGITPMLG